MFKLVLISALIAAAFCLPAEKDKANYMEPSETSWNSAWANPANPNAAAWGGNTWNRWNNPNADPRWNRWGAAEPWNRQWGGANTAGWNQWNRAGSAWPAAGAPAGAAAARGGWNTW
ncbi:AAEL001390-PA [Aedes aegypti]|uniref:AAEL001390-PA n=2 Tax=Aedes aegypti TaxID=7159 RepID=A0A1S4EYR8_AEDAE|nr:uncharacterized protein LOC5570331 [Aedes aegypti]EAT47506.1 AAEL001390-PA [Aedes aegypti]